MIKGKREEEHKIIIIGQRMSWDGGEKRPKEFFTP